VLRWFLLLLFAIAFGVASWGMAHAFEHRLSVVAALGAPWLLAAFGAGLTMRSRWTAALAGAAVPAVATAAYYATFLTVYPGSARYSVAMTVGWGGSAAVAGALFGACARDPRTRWAIAGALLVAEALALTAQQGPGSTLLGAELIAGLGVLAWAAYRAPAITAALVLALVPAFAVAELTLLDTMRALGWGGG
jgi:hypothetical protein